jgi:DNA-binding transcriptional LysR family regulator
MNLLASLRYLVALHDHRHFGRAAQACHITQPALSNALRVLEDELGAVVVKRGRSFAGFTPEGERVLASARRMLHEDESLRQDLQSAAGRPKGRLTLGVVPTAMPVAAHFAARLQAQHEGIVPVVRSMSSPEIESGLDDLSIDLGLGYSERMARRGMSMQLLPQYTERYFLVRKAPRTARARLRLGKAISWKEAATQPLCLLTPEMHNRSIVDAAFKAAGASVSPAIETNSILTLALSALHGKVCGVLPGVLVGVVRSYGELEALPLVGPQVLTPMGLMAQRSERPMRAVQAALELARQPEWLAQVHALSGGALD